jgi:hypothetical protein
MAAKLDTVDRAWRGLEKSILLERLDHHWKEHLATLDALRQVVFLRAYAQKTPINEYKQEAFGLFEKMLDAIREDVTRILMISEIRMQPMPGFPASRTARFPHQPHRSVHRRKRCRAPGSGAAAMLGRWAAAQAGGAAPAGDGSLCRPGHEPQCAVPLRLGPEVQALPRRGGLTRRIAPPGHNTKRLAHKTGGPCRALVDKTIKLTLRRRSRDAGRCSRSGPRRLPQSAKEARGNGNRADVETFTEAADRIGKLIAKIRAKLD